MGSIELVSMLVRKEPIKIQAEYTNRALQAAQIQTLSFFVGPPN